MELKRQWCDQPFCHNWGQVDAGNIQVHSHVEQRLYCTTCLHTFSVDRGTFFETLRSECQAVLEILELLGERNSLRAIERLKHRSTNTVLHWLDLAGQHLAAVSAELIHDVQLRQAQVDELWTFVKKSRRIVNPTTRQTRGIRGFGVRWLCPVGSASSVISARSAAKPKPPSF
jgi:transposase-like protein